MGFTLSTHFCGGHAVESVLAIGNQHVDCGMMEDKQEPSNHDDGKTTLSKIPCCSNEYSEYSIEDDYSAEVISIDVNNTFLFAFVYTYLSPILDHSDDNRLHTYYDSPPLIPDIPILNQSFLI